ncbi:MAG: DNA adenine methylase [Actinomycetota bacterium]
MIKYLGSKRRLVPLIGGLVSGVGATTALDLFTGSTRVARAMKASGVHVTAIDRTRAAHVLARCSIATDADEVDHERLARLVDELDALPGRAGYVTEVFCRQARYFRPENGERIDAVRSAIDDLDVDDPVRPVLLTSLIQAADRVDSTAGVQMAYLKRWAPRASNPLRLRVPELLAGPGRAVVGDALDLVGEIDPVDVAYLDPPYNQHRYESNYHVWETLVAGDEPDHYGVARKRVDLRDPSSRSPFNLRREMPTALESVVRRVRAEVVVVSVSDEAWVPVDEVVRWCRPRGEVAVIEVGSPRYVGARIGIHGRDGSRVGAVSHTRLREFLVVAGPPDRVAAALAGGAAELEALDGVVLGPDRSA